MGQDGAKKNGTKPVENKQNKEKKVKGDSKGAGRTQIAEIGKRELLQKLFEGTGYSNCEIQKAGGAGRSFLNTSKLMLEGVDFDLVYTPLKHLGYKSALLALGSVYANSYRPAGLNYHLGISARFCAEEVVEFWTGVVAAAKEHRIVHLGLDLEASMTGLAIGISAVGEQKDSVIAKFPPTNRNSLICLTGNVGAAYMGLHVLEREKAAFNKIPAARAAGYVQPDLGKYKYLLSQYLSPEINPKTIDQFEEAGLFPSAGYFVTRGLAQAVRQLCSDAGFGARIYLDKIPIAAQTFEMAEEIHLDAITAALNGGDDYKFLFLIPLEEHEKFHKEFPNMDIIGHLTAKEEGAALVTPEGATLELKAL